MGAVTADVVVSTFFNFNPELVHAAIPAAGRWRRRRRWSRPASTPSTRPSGGCWATQVLASDEMRRAAELARAAAEEAGRRRGGTAAGGRPRRRGVARRAAPGAVARPVDPARVPRRRPHRAARRARSVGPRGAGHPRRGRRRAGAPPALDAGLARGRLGRRRRRACGREAGSSRATSSASPSWARRSAGRSRTGPTRWPRRPMPCWARSAAPNCGPWPGPGARRSPSSCPEASTMGRDAPWCVFVGGTVPPSPVTIVVRVLCQIRRNGSI